MAASRIQTYQEFWPFYLREHARPLTRRLHVFGTTLAGVFLAAAVLGPDIRFAVAALVSGYLFAWIAHFLVEGNRPATFRYPLWSLRADFQMCGMFWTSKLNAELQRHGVE